MLIKEEMHFQCHHLHIEVASTRTLAPRGHDIYNFGSIDLPSSSSLLKLFIFLMNQKVLHFDVIKEHHLFSLKNDSCMTFCVKSSDSKCKLM